MDVVRIIALLLNFYVYCCYGNIPAVKNCGAVSSAVFQVDQLPKELIIKNNATFPITASLYLHKKLPSSIRLEISLAKKIGVWVRVPCFGCDKTITCEDLPQYCTFRQMCQDQCTVSVKNFLITLPGNIEEKIPTYIPDNMLNGYTWIRVKVLDDEKRHNVLGCVEFYLNLKK